MARPLSYWRKNGFFTVDTPDSERELDIRLFQAFELAPSLSDIELDSELVSDTAKVLTDAGYDDWPLEARRRAAVIVLDRTLKPERPEQYHVDAVGKIPDEFYFSTKGNAARV